MTEDINELINSFARTTDKATLDDITDLAVKRFDLGINLTDLAERSKDINKSIRDLDFKLLPEAMISAGINAVSVQPEGNRPSFRVALADYYKAVIQVGWDNARREQAFAVLANHGLEDIIRIEVTVSFPAGAQREADKFIENAVRNGYLPEVKKTVPWMTLTAAIKEIYASGKTLSDAELEALGAVVGKIAELKTTRTR